MIWLKWNNDVTEWQMYPAVLSIMVCPVWSWLAQCGGIMAHSTGSKGEDLSRNMKHVHQLHRWCHSHQVLVMFSWCTQRCLLYRAPEKKMRKMEMVILFVYIFPKIICMFFQDARSIGQWCVFFFLFQFWQKSFLWSIYLQIMQIFLII